MSSHMTHNRMQLDTGKYAATESVKQELKKKKMLSSGGGIDGSYADRLMSNRNNFVRALLKD